MMQCAIYEVSGSKRTSDCWFKLSEIKRISYRRNDNSNVLVDKEDCYSAVRFLASKIGVVKYIKVILTRKVQ